MTTFINRHPLLAFYFLTFAISWGGFVFAVGPDSLINTNWQAAGAFLPAIVAMLAGPSIAGLLLTGLIDGRAGYQQLWSRLRTWRVGMRWYALAILPAPVVAAGVLFALSLPAPLLTGPDKAVVVLGGLLAGLTTIFEEIGWTGFVVPRLRRRHSVARTGIMVGALWGLWHLLQQIFISGTYAGGIPWFAFLMLSVTAAVASLTAYRVLMVWLYDRTGSLLVTTLMHGLLTASTIFWFTTTATGWTFLADVWLVAAMMWLIVGVIAVGDGWLATRPGGRAGRTTAFRGDDGRVLPNSVAEVMYLRLGGVEQWVLIRGENADNPPLIVLHGGPGMSDMAFFRRFNAPLERHFTVVHWDQRGTGKSFDRDLPKSSMTLEQFVADLDELVGFVCRRLRKQKVVLLGHSWGSALGAVYASRFPQNVSVYVGAAQIGDSAVAESMSYSFGLAEAERRHDRKTLKKLRAIGHPPYPARSLFVERTAVNRLDGQMRPRILWKIGRALVAGPESSIFDLPNLIRGFRFSIDAMWAETSTLNLLQRVPALKMPVFIFVGRRDHWVPPEASVAFFNALGAPSKTLVWFAQSGHEAFVDEPEKFNASMVELVWPLASTSGAERAMTA